MSNYVEVAAETGDKYLESLADSQDRFLRYVASWSQWTPKQPPLAANAPAVIELTGVWYSFSEKLLAQQKSFLEKFFAAMSARDAGVARPAPVKRSSPSSSEKRAKVTPAKRPTAKKSSGAKKAAAKAASKKTTSSKRSAASD